MLHARKNEIILSSIYCRTPFSSRSLVFPTYLSRSIKIEIYRTGILPVVFYGRAVVFHIKRSSELRMLTNKALRKIFGL
jgi:hypothetical protein